MDVVIRAAIFDGKRVKYKFFHTLTVLLTEMQSGHLDPTSQTKGLGEPNTEFTLLFEHGAWIESFEPEEFSKVLARLRESAPKRDYSKAAPADLQTKIKAWRKAATEEIQKLSLGAFE